MATAKRTSLLVLGLAFAIALLPASTYAVTLTNEPAPKTDCTIAKKRIATHTTAVLALQADHNAKYTTMKGRVDTLISTATAAKYTGISKLTAARDSISTALSAYTAQTEVYKTALETAQAAPCGEGTGEFIDALTAARTELKTLRDDGLSVKLAFKQNAAPALREYATWLKDNTNVNQVTP